MTRRQQRRHRVRFNRIRRRSPRWPKDERWGVDGCRPKWATVRGSSRSRWRAVVRASESLGLEYASRSLSRALGLERWATKRGLL